MSQLSQKYLIEKFSQKLGDEWELMLSAVSINVGISSSYEVTFNVFLLQELFTLEDHLGWPNVRSALDGFHTARGSSVLNDGYTSYTITQNYCVYESYK